LPSSTSVGDRRILWTASRATTPNDRCQSDVHAGELDVRQTVKQRPCMVCVCVCFTADYYNAGFDLQTEALSDISSVGLSPKKRTSLECFI